MHKFRLIVLSLFAIASVAGLAFTSPAPVAAYQQGDTWGISASVLMCEDNPRVIGEAANCEAAGGVTILVYENGENFIGSCVTEVIDTPWGNQMAYCVVEGAPFNTTLHVSQDPDSIPAGYTPLESSYEVEVGNLVPGGGDQTTVTFIDVANSGDVSDPPTSGIGGVEFFAAIHHGTCDNIQAVVSALIPARLETGAPVGNPDAITMPTSLTTVNESLDVLIDEQHVVVIHKGIQPESDIMLCGVIGGVDNDDGQLFIGLGQTNMAAYIGAAILSYGTEEGTTDIRLFMIPA